MDTLKTHEKLPPVPSLSYWKKIKSLMFCVRLATNNETRPTHKAGRAETRGSWPHTEKTNL